MEFWLNLCPFLFCSNYAAFGQIGLSMVEFPSVLKGLLMNAILVMLGLIYAHFRVSSVFKAGLDFGEKNLRRCRNLRAGDHG